MTAHSRPWVLTAQAPARRPAPRLGASAGADCGTVRRIRLTTRARRRGQCAVQHQRNRYHGRDEAHQDSKVPTRTTLTRKFRAIADSAPTGRISVTWNKGRAESQHGPVAWRSVASTSRRSRRFRLGQSSRPARNRPQFDGSGSFRAITLPYRHTNGWWAGL